MDGLLHDSGCEANGDDPAYRVFADNGHPGTQHSYHDMEDAVDDAMATLSATGNRKTQAGFRPLSGFVRVPYNDLAAIRAIAEHNKSVVAVMLEIVQAGWYQYRRPGTLRALRQLCIENGWLLICDEVRVRHGAYGEPGLASACRYSPGYRDAGQRSRWGRSVVAAC